MAPSQERAAGLDFAKNWQKSFPVPTQLIIRRVGTKAEMLSSLLSHIMPHGVVTAISVMHVLGIIFASHVVFPL